MDRTSSRTNSADGVAEENGTAEYEVASVGGINDIEERKPKDLLCIRHGVSLANEFIGNRWGSPTFRDDPKLIDTALSKAGMQCTKTELPEQLLQQDDLRSFLIGTKIDTRTTSDNTGDGGGSGGVELVLVSPLTRCLQTYMLGVEPVLSELFARQDGGEINSSTTGDRKYEKDNNSSISKLPIPVLALPLLRERVYTASDTGRPISVLEKEFPSIDFSGCRKASNERQGLDGDENSIRNGSDDDVWWYTGQGKEYEEWRAHGEGQWYAVPGEPEEVFDRRMEELKEWLFKRKETKILLVAHWGVLRYLSDGVEWKNSEAKIIRLLPNS